jgi:hypothetical protein
LGLSIGATNLAAVTADHAITRKPVLTLYRQRPPEVGVPSENPRLDEPGLVITDFVDRVGDRVGIVAADGSMHRSEALVADGLRALAYAATGGRALPDSVAVTYPAHWAPATVDALGGALSRVAEWSRSAKPLSLVPDAAAALFAVRANPGIPARGIIAVCDFGGSGTSVTLVDASGDYQPVAPTIRHHDFSGDLIDQVRSERHRGDRLAGPVAGRLPQCEGTTFVDHGYHRGRSDAGNARRDSTHPYRTRGNNSRLAGRGRSVSGTSLAPQRNSNSGGDRDGRRRSQHPGGDHITVRSLRRAGNYHAASATHRGHRRCAARCARAWR